jgi:hypothetical protein
MTIYYIDTSAVVKRYFPEQGTLWMTALADTAAANTLLMSELTLAETAAAIAAKQRAPGGISIVERDGIINRFLQHSNDEYTLIPSQRTVIDRAVSLTQRHRLRGYDAVQLATALLIHEQYTAARLPALTFVSADSDLLNAARAEGLSTENPNEYP